MEGIYPIRWDNADRGTLTVTREGLTTCFRGECEDPGRILRLSVFGEGREGYLGVMQPEKGRMTLRRRMTRSALTGFPGTIDYAGEAGTGVPPKMPEVGKAETKTAGEEPQKAASRPETVPEEPSADLLWYALGDGSLYTVYRQRAYRAIPLCRSGMPRANFVENRTIEGIRYAVYAESNGNQSM